MENFQHEDEKTESEAGSGRYRRGKKLSPRVMVVGDPFLEASLCWPELTAQGMGSWPSCHNSAGFLVKTPCTSTMHVSVTLSRGAHEQIRKVSVLESGWRRWRLRWCFSSAVPVKDKGFSRSRCIHEEIPLYLASSGVFQEDFGLPHHGGGDELRKKTGDHSWDPEQLLSQSC